MSTRHRLGRDAVDALAGALAACRCDEVLDEQRDVLRPLAQRRQRDRDDVEPVVQVLPEPAVRDELPQVAVGRGDDAHVDLDRLRVRPSALELALLQHAQQLGLELERDARRSRRGRSSRRRPARSGPSCSPIGAGEGALLVAEELALDQRLGERRAVDRARAACRARRCGAWMARATSSLPVPVSPVISTVLRDCATSRAVLNDLLNRPAPPDDAVVIELARRAR